MMERIDMRITSTNKVVWLVIEEFINVYGYAPSRRDIMRIGNISSISLVNYNIKKLEKFKIISTTFNTARAIRLLVPFASRNTVKGYSNEHN